MPLLRSFKKDLARITTNISLLAELKPCTGLDHTLTQLYLTFERQKSLSRFTPLNYNHNALEYPSLPVELVVRAEDWLRLSEQSLKI